MWGLLRSIILSEIVRRVLDALWQAISRLIRRL
jgi:hypothetical protein